MEKRKMRTGIVISDKMNKTRVVSVERRVRHSLYEKVMRKVKNYYVHDEKNEAHPGDRVLVVETKPKSRLKRWRLLKILEKAE